MVKSRSIRQVDIKLLWGRAAARCSRCERDVIEEETAQDEEAIIGENAHIVDFKGKGKRVDPNLSQEDINKYKNLILLCANCHTLLDDQDATYTIEYLRELKIAHEEWVRTSLAKAASDITFRELEMVADHILRAPTPVTTDMTLTDPKEKMRKNSLTEKVLFYFNLGMSNSHVASTFIANTARIQPDYPERLRAGFLSEYKSLRSLGYKGDDLFLALAEFAAKSGGAIAGGEDFPIRAAGLTVLVHLFQVCEIFER